MSNVRDRAGGFVLTKHLHYQNSRERVGNQSFSTQLSWVLGTVRSVRRRSTQVERMEKFKGKMMGYFPRARAEF